MIVYNEICIQNYKGISEVNIKNLGSINVLSGKNNSGKTTILKAIYEGKFKYGILSQNISTQKVLTHFKKYLMSFVEEESGDLIDSYHIGYHSKADDILEKLIDSNIIESYLLENKIIYSNEHYTFYKEIKDNLIKKYPKLYDEWNWHEPNESKIYDEIFDSLINIDTEIKYIDAKRRLTSQISIPNYNEKKHLLKELFYLKNSEHPEDIKLLEKLENAFRGISGGYCFKIKTDRNFKLTLSFVTIYDEEYEASECGLGLRDLLLILSYALLMPATNILLIEEPENHIHPEIQRKLIFYLQKKTSKQYFISSHSNIFLDTNIVDNVFLVSYNDKKITLINSNNKASLLYNLGYSVSDNLLAQLVILVEGPSDKMILEEFLIKLEVLPKYNVKIWAMGGSIMNQHDFSVFTENYNVIALIDDDPGEVRTIFNEQCKELGIQITKLDRYAIENYFTVKALKHVFGNQIKVDINTKIKPNQNIKEQELGSFNSKKGDNPRKIAQAMSFDDICNTDLGRFILDIKNRLEDNS